jgi:inorganic pyrophosphatase
MDVPSTWATLSIWEHADRLVSNGRLVIDRPAMARHHKMPEYVYPFDYGYLAGTTGGDGEGIDVWVGSYSRHEVTAVACTIDPVKENAELKILWRCTSHEIAEIEKFYVPQPQAALVIIRPGVNT